jgi:ABC-type sugar transport system permease subunit
VVFAFLSVLITFTLGLGLALVVNDRRIPFVGTFRALSIVPYAVPGFISALVWVGLMNPFYGQFNQVLRMLTGVSPEWFSDPTLAKVAILLVNLWLGYPYMLLISLGALQSIPGELFEAASMDGASGPQRFRFITLPLLLVALGPLLIGSFAFNFNNFTLIDLVTGGGPPVSGTSQPAGATDILISYTFRLAFTGGQGGRGVDYGFAAALSVFIFLITAALTAFNFRFSRQLEQVSENL